VALRTPETVRGVEFDAVVVVEPGAFPRNLARVGPLYTSLTRSNRELVVVHSQALPDELRRHGRR
jgi:DNA helicase II / ATP-dependent DNA helicase PcrA